MPTYDYRCAACGHQFEQSQSIMAKVLTRCPKCEKRSLQRLLGTGGGIIFKGSGFHQTDYRSDAYKKAAAADTKAGAADTKAPAAKSEKDATPKPEKTAPTDAKKSKQAAGETSKVA